MLVLFRRYPVGWLVRCRSGKLGSRFRILFLGGLVVGSVQGYGAVDLGTGGCVMLASYAWDSFPALLLWSCFAGKDSCWLSCVLIVVA